MSSPLGDGRLGPAVKGNMPLWPVRLILKMGRERVSPDIDVGLAALSGCGWSELLVAALGPAICAPSTVPVCAPGSGRWSFDTPDMASCRAGTAAASRWGTCPLNDRETNASQRDPTRLLGLELSAETRSLSRKLVAGGNASTWFVGKTVGLCSCRLRSTLTKPLLEVLLMVATNCKTKL